VDTRERIMLFEFYKGEEVGPSEISNTLLVMIMSSIHESKYFSFTVVVSLSK